MNWKDFFKPDWKKIIASVAFFLIMIFAPIISGTACTQIYPSHCETFFSSLAMKFHASVPLWQQANLLALYVSLLVLSYIISCALVFAYNKYKK